MKRLANKKYINDATLWYKWRLAFEGGDRFIRKYLRRFSSREDAIDFTYRRDMTYCPSFAKEAIIDIRNAIFQRMIEIKRGGPQAYLAACNGEGGGVDKAGATMTQFLGQYVLDELLTMSKVGIWIDNGISQKRSPYIYMYQVEDILNWDDENNPTTILLREEVPQYHATFGVQTPPKTMYRHATVKEGKTYVQMYDQDQKKVGSEFVLDFDRLPFVVLSLKESLMKDIANYQIALLNIASADMNYTLRANFPFYTEQYDMKADAMQKFAASPPSSLEYDGTNQANVTDNAVDVGVTNGRRYPIGAERPGFIAPPTEPLTASMAKQAQLKEEIRILVSLSLSNLSPTRASQESKQQDETGLEAGLSCVGQELERAEKIIASVWAEYLGDKTAVDIEYPVDYSLKNDEQRQAEAEKDLDLIPKVVSKTAQRELAKRAVTKLFGGKLNSEMSVQIEKELDAASVLAIDPNILTKDLENFLVSPKYASFLRGYPEGESEAAEEAHEDKLRRIAEAQSLAAVLAQTGVAPEAEATAPNTPGEDTSKSEKEKKQPDPMEGE